MGIAERIAKLEQRAAPASPSIATQFAATLHAGRRRREAMTPKQRAAEERARHRAALNAGVPGERASALAHRLYAANRRLAQDWLNRCGSAEDADDAQLW